MKPIWMALAVPAMLAAHGLSVDVEPAAPAVILRASYDHADPAGRADVIIFRPGESESPYQTGSTDATGVFAFVPSEPGAWLAVVDDGFGHRTETVVDWAGSEAGVRSSEGAGPWRNALTGVSLLIGLTGIWLWRQSKAGNSGRPRP